MNTRLIIAIVLSALLGALLLASSVSASLLQSLENKGLTVQYAKGSPLNGQAFMHVNHPAQKLWLDVNWRWCPSINIARWCVDFSGDTINGSTKLSTNFASIRLDDAMINAESIELILAGFITTEASIEAHIKNAKLSQASQLDAIKELEAVVLISNINAMGFGFEPHRISALREPSKDFMLEISGTEANGSSQVKANGQYEANIALTLEPVIAELLSQQLPKGPDGSLTYTDKGTLPLAVQ